MAQPSTPTSGAGPSAPNSPQAFVDNLPDGNFDDLDQAYEENVDQYPDEDIPDYHDYVPFHQTRDYANQGSNRKVLKFEDEVVGQGPANNHVNNLPPTPHQRDALRNQTFHNQYTGRRIAYESAVERSPTVAQTPRRKVDKTTIGSPQPVLIADDSQITPTRPPPPSNENVVFGQAPLPGGGPLSSHPPSGQATGDYTRPPVRRKPVNGMSTDTPRYTVEGGSSPQTASTHDAQASPRPPNRFTKLMHRASFKSLRKSFSGQRNETDAGSVARPQTPGGFSTMSRKKRETGWFGTKRKSAMFGGDLDAMEVDHATESAPVVLEKVEVREKKRMKPSPSTPQLPEVEGIIEAHGGHMEIVFEE